VHQTQIYVFFNI